MMKTEERSDIQIANELYSIVDACNIAGMGTSGGNAKQWCPFGEIAHSDGGMAKAFRIYEDTNTAHCFACQATWTPVKLVAQVRDVSYESAADYILTLINYVAPDVDSQWAALMSQQQKVNADDLAEALKVACLRMAPDWEVRQFEDLVAHKFRQCLDLLPKIHTEEAANKWLTIAKQAMKQELGAS
jgi:hypothetical protein